MTTTTASSDVATVRAHFEAFGHGDLAAFAARLDPDATWNHRNDDRLGGIHRGRDGITAFLGESAQLTGSNIHAEPQAIMADGEGRVAVLVRMTGERLDGRTFDVPQILLCAVDSARLTGTTCARSTSSSAIRRP
jgi:ketosteroid isomerase-like protein